MAKSKVTFKDDGHIYEAGYKITKCKNGSYSVDLGRASGRHIRKRFKTVKDAKRYAQLQRDKRKAQGTQAHRLSDKQLLDAIEGYSILQDSDADLRTAARYYIKYHPTHQNKDLCIKPLVSEFLSYKQNEVDAGNLRQATLTDYQTRLLKFAKGNEGLLATHITSNDVDEWLDASGFSKTNRSNYRRCLSVFFNYLVDKGITEYNPVAKTKRIRQDSHLPTIWTVGQTTAIFKAAMAIDHKHRDDFIAYLSLLFWAGLRPLEGMRISWQDIDLNTGRITVKPSVSKTATERRIYAESNLIEWLTAYRSDGPVFGHSDSVLRACRDAVVKAAGLDAWLPDASRHSFATMHLNKHDSIPRTCECLGHRSPDMLVKNYWSDARHMKDAGERYFSITPSSLTATITDINSKTA